MLNFFVKRDLDNDKKNYEQIMHLDETKNYVKQKHIKILNFFFILIEHNKIL